MSLSQKATIFGFLVRVRYAVKRLLRVLKSCGVEMLIIDEADRLKPKTFAEVRDIFDKLNIAVVLVGTDRLGYFQKRKYPL